MFFLIDLRSLFYIFLDEFDDKVQKTGFEIIALRAPQAADLRRIIVALKIATIFICKSNLYSKLRYKMFDFFSDHTNVY